MCQFSQLFEHLSLGCSWMEPVFPKTLVGSYPGFSFEEWKDFLSGSSIIDMLEMLPLSSQCVLMPAMAFERFLFVCHSTTVKTFYTKPRRIIFFAILVLLVFLLPAYHVVSRKMYGLDDDYDYDYYASRRRRGAERGDNWKDYRWNYRRWGGKYLFYEWQDYFYEFRILDRNNVLSLCKDLMI